LVDLPLPGITRAFEPIATAWGLEACSVC